MFEKIRAYLASELDISEDEITRDTTFESLGVDSLDMVELICELEERLGVDFGEPEGLETMSDLVKYVDSL